MERNDGNLGFFTHSHIITTKQYLNTVKSQLQVYENNLKLLHTSCGKCGLLYVELGDVIKFHLKMGSVNSGKEVGVEDEFRAVLEPPSPMLSLNEE